MFKINDLDGVSKYISHWFLNDFYKSGRFFDKFLKTDRFRDLENKLYYVKLYVYNEHISTLLDKVISIWETPDIAELREPESDNVV